MVDDPRARRDEARLTLQALLADGFTPDEAVGIVLEAPLEPDEDPPSPPDGAT